MLSSLQILKLGSQSSPTKLSLNDWSVAELQSLASTTLSILKQNNVYSCKNHSGTSSIPDTNNTISAR